VRRVARTALIAVAATLCFGGASAAASSGYVIPPPSPMPAKTFNPALEALNFAVTQERQAIYDTPAYQAQLTVDSAASATQALATEAADPGRFFTNNLCWNLANGCAGDIRLYNWATNGYGLVRPVLFTARDGATISGHVWATVGGPAKRPGIVITNGSVQADEQMYWYAAQTLAKEGYIVLTFDPQGQGQSDTFGQAPDTDEGVPAQTDGRPFYDGTEDAIDFLLSTPSHPYEPVPSCTTGTSHAAKQNERVKQGFDAAYNPFWSLLNPKELGLVGHSYGAAGVSYIAQWDPRVKAVVALDNLGGPSPDAGQEGSVSGISASVAPGEQGCPGDPADRTTVPITKPGLGISADYFLPPTPNVKLPDPTTKELESQAYSKAGVDSGEIVIRGGSHLDFSFIPNQAFGASYYGPDIVDWYTTAWFDKYLKHEASADNMLMSDRWRDYAPEAAIDPNHDGNAFSFYFYSRMDIHLADGTRWECEDLRDGCPGMVPTAKDGYEGNYSYVSIDTSPDSVVGPGQALTPVRKGCPEATGKLRGDRLGLLRLGMSRSRARLVYRRSSTRGFKYKEFFCLTPRGVRVGYASPKLVGTLPKAERKHLLGHVIWASTSNEFYSVRGIRPGATLAAAAKALHPTGPFHVGLNFWYLASNGPSTAVLKVRHGIVEEIGIGDRALLHGHKADLVFLESFD
jgi:dienelactone hydrolase